MNSFFSHRGSLLAALVTATALTSAAAHAQLPTQTLRADVALPTAAPASLTNLALVTFPAAPDAPSSADPAPAASSSSAATLPDAPSAILLTAYAPAGAYLPQGPNAGRPSTPVKVAPIYTKYIPAGWTAQKINARDKVIIGARDLYAPLTLLGDLTSAGYSDLVNGQPNYGTNGKAIGQRIGATVLRDTTEGVLSDMVFSPIFHEDPRYYVQGSSHNFFERILYAATRPIITRTDSGHSSINAAILVGYAGASATTYAYYPQINRNFKDTAATFGGGLGGAAIGDVVSEFADGFLQAIHLEKRD
jgi:hypothetical protein